MNRKIYELLNSTINGGILQSSFFVNLFIGSEEQDHSIPAVCKGFEDNDEGYPVWYFTTHDGIEIAIESTSSNYDYLSPGAILYLEFKY